MDGCFFVWTGKVFLKNSYVSPSPVRRTAQSALHVMLLSYYIGMCVFHEQGFVKVVYMSNDRQNLDPA